MIVAVDDETGEAVGYGAWIPAEADLDGEIFPVIRVIRFGVDEGYKGVLDGDSGKRVAEELYEAVERHAVLASPPGTAIELFCDAANERGLRFWTGLGFTLIDTKVAGSRAYSRFWQSPAELVASGGNEDTG